MAENGPKTLERDLAAQGFSPQDFLDFCGSVAVAAGLDETQASAVATALEHSYGATSDALYPVLWLEGASCSGCTESFAQLASPGIAAVILEMISLNYSDVLAAGAGSSFESAKEETIAAGDYLLVYEGAITLAFEGHSLRYGNAPGIDHIEEAARHARAVIALGSCAVNGGWMAAPPNAPEAVGVQSYLERKGISVPVINIPGCPANPDWLMTVFVSLVLLGGLAATPLDGASKPEALFCDTVHDNCSRRSSFTRGEFAFGFDTPETAAGFCLYGLGCKGPQTKALCPITLWNSRKSWCVYAGAPCIGCCDSTPGQPSWFARNRSVNGADRRAVPFTLLGFTDFGLAVLPAVIAFSMKLSS